MIGGEKHKVSLYVDDVWLSSIPDVKEYVSQFGFYSGYKFNVDKTEAMDISGKIPLQVEIQSGPVRALSTWESLFRHH